MDTPGRRDLKAFYAAMVEHGMYSDEGKLRYFLDTFLEGISFEGRRVLDVGGGRGLLTFYAAARGAAEAVCMEPLGEGSREATDEEFHALRERLGLGRARLSRSTIQEYEPDGGGFDVILLHNSVNHLDENACIHLLESDEARDAYREIFRRLARLANPGAHLVIADCSRRNLFPTLGLRNPFVPTIEWHKHQEPEVWADVLGECGFRDPTVRWSTFNTLREPGRLLLGNRLAAFLLFSHFRLRMRRG